MKINIFWGDLTDISAKTATLIVICKYFAFVSLKTHPEIGWEQDFLSTSSLFIFKLKPVSRWDDDDQCFFFSRNIG